MTEKKRTTATAQSKKPAKENAGTGELSEQDLGKATGGTTIGSATGGAGAGKVVFTP